MMNYSLNSVRTLSNEDSNSFCEEENTESDAKSNHDFLRDCLVVIKPYYKGE